MREGRRSHNHSRSKVAPNRYHVLGSVGTFQAPLRDASGLAVIPALKRWAIFERSLRDVTTPHALCRQSCGPGMCFFAMF